MTHKWEAIGDERVMTQNGKKVCRCTRCRVVRYRMAQRNTGYFSEATKDPYPFLTWKMRGYMGRTSPPCRELV